MLERIYSIYDRFLFYNEYRTIDITIDILIAFFIFFVFWVLRKRLTGYIFNILLKLSEKTKTSLDNHLVLSFQKPVRSFFIILGIYLSLYYLPLNPVYDIFISKFFRSAIIVLLALGFYNLAGSYSALHEEFERIFNAKVDKILIPFFSKVVRAILIALTISIVAQEWGYNVNGFIAGLGLGGLAFALAAKDTVSNIFGGLVIIIDKPFSIGDWIHTPSVEGTVEDINFRSTRVRTFAQALVTVPNASLVNEPITNWTKMGKRRISFKLGVTYDTPKNKLEKCVREIQTMLEKHPEIHQETIVVRFDSFGASSLDIYLYFFTKTTLWTEYLKVKEDINFKIMEILEREGVDVAFPSTSVYFETPLEMSEEKGKQEKEFEVEIQN